MPASRTRVIASLLVAWVLAVIVFAGQGAWTAAQAPQPVLSAEWRLLPRAPFGGKLEVRLTNRGTTTMNGVSIHGPLPEPLVFAGPWAVPTVLHCQNSLSPTSTSCTHPPRPEQVLEDLVGQTIRIDQEQMLVVARTPAGSNTVQLVRGVNGTTAAAHEPESPISYMRPDWFTPTDATATSCVVGLPRQIGCYVDGLAPGAIAVLEADLGVTPGTTTLAQALIELEVDWTGGDTQHVRVPTRSLGGLLAASTGPYRLTLPGLGRDGTADGTGERLVIAFAAGFPSVCEVATGTPLSWALGGWAAATRALADDFIEKAPIVATLDGQPVSPQVAFSTITTVNDSGETVQAELALWTYVGSALAAGEHVFTVQWGPALADIEDGLGQPTLQGEVIGPVTRRVIVNAANAYPATTLPPCAIYPR